mmetsp:Transcript_7770/g.11685  ORF Transcript_7770/g.11685 Transcript_7770/m.11685 type:complete len:102 (-) Transcript_7770:146-451(-)
MPDMTPRSTGLVFRAEAGGLLVFRGAVSGWEREDDDEDDDEEGAEEERVDDGTDDEVALGEAFADGALVDEAVVDCAAESSPAIMDPIMPFNGLALAPLVA